MRSPKRVLIVDDNDEIVAAICVRLLAAGYEPISAFDGQQAIDSAVETHPDAILLDVRMPVKDGLEVLDELRSLSDTKSIPVVMLSASTVDQQAALEAGARYFIRKPYEARQLVQTIEVALAAMTWEPVTVDLTGATGILQPAKMEQQGAAGSLRAKSRRAWPSATARTYRGRITTPNQ